MEETPAAVKVKRARTGLGLFAEEPIKKGDFIIEYTGEKVTADEADRRGGQYLFEMTPEWTLDGKDRKHTGRYINHSCKPNAEAELDEEELRVYIRACKNIKAGEEITYDYGKEFWDEHIKPKGCKCRACYPEHSSKKIDETL